MFREDIFDYVERKHGTLGIVLFALGVAVVILSFFILCLLTYGIPLAIPVGYVVWVAVKFHFERNHNE